MRPLRVLSWNVNGLRACTRKGFAQWLEAQEADVVGVQEVRAQADQLPEEIGRRPGWHTHFASALRPGYSGVGLFTRPPADVIETTLGRPRFDDEGRVQIARFGRLAVANVYFPNGSGVDRDNSRVAYKLAFYRALRRRLETLRAEGFRVLVMGDFNTAHREIDLARPKSNVQTSGFLPEERAELDRWIRGGWVDAFRRFEDGPDHYTWWSQRLGVREKNIGWRIDLILAAPEAVPYLQRAFHQPEVSGSDHCPIGAELDPAVIA